MIHGLTRSYAGTLAALATMLALVQGCARPVRELVVQQQPPSPLQAASDDLQWFRQARFGMFVHWGPVSLKGTEISWSRAATRPGMEGLAVGKIPAEEYDKLYQQFNPTEFDARKWVAIAKSAGMKYLVFTTKHHDGFCMFDSALTDYKITNTPFKRDIVAEVAQACHEGGLKLGFYYSPPDWHHPDYRSPTNHARYVEYLHGQLRELCTRYGKVDIIWFDGLNSTAAELESEKLIAMIRQLQPGVLINNRAGLPGDYDTPEQTVGGFQKDRPWESCITIGTQWSYKPDDKVKSREEIIQTLAQCAGGDGSLLFNVGPTPLGEIEPLQVERLKEVGQWLKQHGETIYGTRGGPFVSWPWGVSTHKGERVYLHVLNWPEGGIKLPEKAGKVASCSVLTGGEAQVRQTPKGTVIQVAPEHRDKADTILLVKLDQPLAQVGIIEPLSVAKGKKATASNVFSKDATYAAEKALDGDRATRWATDGGVKSAWLEIDLGEPKAFKSAMISEAFGRVREFEIQVRNGEDEAWRTITRGKKIGASRLLSFEPVTARFVRLNILKATDGPTIWEFHLYRED